jgi:hypothetical protein
VTVARETEVLHTTRGGCGGKVDLGGQSGEDGLDACWFSAAHTVGVEDRFVALTDAKVVAELR